MGSEQVVETQYAPADTAADARVANAAACVTQALGHTRVTPVLVRAMATNVVFRVGPLAAKVWPVDADLSKLEQRLAVLGEVDTTAWVAAVGHTVHKNEFGAIAFYQWCTQSGRASWSQIGSLLREAHSVTVPSVTQLPHFQPLSKVSLQMQRYLATPGASQDVVDTVMTAREALLAQIGNLQSDLGFGFIHGDVSPSNTARLDNKLAFIDLDECGYGPREYDLVGAAMRLRSGEITSRTYAAFCRNYGYDVREWSFLPVIEEIATLGATSFLLGEAGASFHDHPAVRSTLLRWGGADFPS